MIQFHSLPLIGSISVAIVIESSYCQVVNVDPYGTTPVGRVLFGIVLEREEEEEEEEGGEGGRGEWEDGMWRRRRRNGRRGS